MTEGEHPDAVERLRWVLGLGGGGEPAAADHLRSCPSCEAESGELTRVRDAVRAFHGAEPSPAAESAARRAVAPPSAEPDPWGAPWLPAVPAGSFGLAGVRSGDAPGAAFRCEDGAFRLDSLFQPAATGERVALSGQVFVGDDEPGAGLEVTLFVDRRAARSVRTDGFGEFVVDVPRGRRVGVRVRAPDGPRHVEFPAGDAR